MKETRKIISTGTWGGDILPPSHPEEVKRILDKLLPELMKRLGIDHFVETKTETNWKPGKPSIHVTMTIYKDTSDEPEKHC